MGSDEHPLILLGYRDRNVHELVCHEVAERAGLYSQRGIAVQAVPAAEHPEAALSAGLGGSLVEALRGLRRWQSLLVHTVHPLFWIWARDDAVRLMELERLAGHPDGSVVWSFTEQLLGDLGVRTDELARTSFPVGVQGDHQRLESLTSGAVEVAVLGSTFAPSALTRLGLKEQIFFADRIRFPTAGVAIDVDKVGFDDPQVLAIVDAQREALELIQSQDPIVVDAIKSLLLGSNREDAELLLEHYLSPQYGPEPEQVQEVGADALAWLSQALSAEPSVAANFYEEIR